MVGKNPDETMIGNRPKSKNVGKTESSLHEHTQKTTIQKAIKNFYEQSISRKT